MSTSVPSIRLLTVSVCSQCLGMKEDVRIRSSGLYYVLDYNRDHNGSNNWGNMQFMSDLELCVMGHAGHEQLLSVPPHLLCSQNLIPRFNLTISPHR